MCIACLSRRDVLQLSALLGAGTALRPRSLRAEAAQAPVKIGYLPITDATPLLVAHARGLFEAEGLAAEKPVLLRSWAQLVEAFVAGQVNVVHLLSPMAVWARFGAKAPLKVVAWNHVDGSALTVSNDIGEIADLGGKTVAVPSWYSIHNVVLQTLLRANNLSAVTKRATPAANEVKLVVMAPSDMPPALATRQVAGFIVAEPFNAAAETLGIGKVLRFTGDVWRRHACCVVAMQEADVQARPEWSQKVVNAIVKAQLWTRANRGETAQLLSKDGPGRYTPHAAALLSKVLAPPDGDRAAYLASGAIRHADWNERRIDFQPFPYASYTEELVRRLKDTVVEGDRAFLMDLDPVAATRDLVEDRFVRTAVTAAGGPVAFGADSLTRTEVIAP